MASIQAQKLTVDLPTLLMTQRGHCRGTTEPFLEMVGCWSVRGTLDFAVEVASHQDDPSQVSLTLRVLSGHYSPPADCPEAVLKAVNQVNADLAQWVSGQ